MVPSFQSMGTVLTGAAHTPSVVDVPPGVVAGDIVLAHFYMQTTTAWSAPPAGWAEIAWPAHATTSPTVQLRTFWHRATGAESGTYSFAHPSMWTEGFATRYSGCIATGTPFQILAAAGSGSTSVTTAPAVSGTTTSNNMLLVHGPASYNLGTWTPAADFSAQSNVALTHRLFLETKLQPVAGATGSITASRSGTASRMAATLLGLIPA